MEYQMPVSGITEQEIRDGFLLFFCPIFYIFQGDAYKM